MSEVYLVERDHYGHQIGSGEVYTEKSTAQSYADAANDYLKVVYSDYTDEIAYHVVAVPTVEGVKEYETLLIADVTHNSPILISNLGVTEEYYLSKPHHQIVDKGTAVPQPVIYEPEDDELAWPYWSATLCAHTMDELTELAQPYIDKFNATL